MHWQTMDSAPLTREFLAERQTTGDWLKVSRNPLYPGDHSCVHAQTGLLWVPLRWTELPAPITRSELMRFESDFAAIFGGPANG